MDAKHVVSLTQKPFIFSTKPARVSVLLVIMVVQGTNAFHAKAHALNVVSVLKCALGAIQQKEVRLLH